MQLRDPLTGRLRSARAHPFAFLAMGATLALIPWTLIYISQLPDHHTARHWNVAWAGFDVLLCCSLGVTAWCALRERALLIVGLIASSTLLVCDAWFDVLTSRTTGELVQAALEAALVELPLAALCFWMATNLARAVEVARPFLRAAGFRIENNRLLPPEDSGGS